MLDADCAGMGLNGTSDCGIPLAFDGTGSAGVTGEIYLGLPDEFGSCNASTIPIASINVYIENSSPSPTWFRVTSSSSNIGGNHLTLSNPYLDGNASQKLFISHVFNPAGDNAGTLWNHPISVSYNTGSAKWQIVNSDGSTMPSGLTFNVHVDPSARTVCAPALGTGEDFEYGFAVDSYPTDANYYASVIATPIDGESHQVAVKFIDPYWNIVYADGAAMTPGKCFNVQSTGFAQYIASSNSDFSGIINTADDNGTGIDVSGAGTGHTYDGDRLFKFDWSGMSASLPIIVTPNLTPMGYTAYSENYYASLIYAGQTSSWTGYPQNHWGLRHDDGTSVSTGAAYNLWAQYQPGLLPRPFDLALGSTVTARSSYVAGPEWGVANLVDGSELGASGYPIGYTSALGNSLQHEEWVVVTMPASKTFSRVVLYPRADPGWQGVAFPKTFTIQVWTGSAWLTRVTETNYPTPTTGAGQAFTWGASDTTNKIRIDATTLGTDGLNGYILQLGEIEIYQ